MIILKVLFHLLSIVFILTSGFRTIYIKSLRESFETNEDEKNMMIFFVIMWAIWIGIGFMTFNWIAFIVLSFVLLIENRLVVLFSPMWIKTTLNVTSGAISTLIGIFILINSWHLKINVYELVKPYILNLF